MPPPQKRVRKEATSIAEDIQLVRQLEDTCGLTSNSSLRLTTLEQQVVDVKKQLSLSLPQTILMVACGYRMRFFGRDARIASRRLGIMCVPGETFEYASIPTVRVDFHASRLVRMGYIVGIVDQTETAAVRQEDGKHGVFTRALTSLRSRGTWLPTNEISSTSVVAQQAQNEDEDGKESGEDDNTANVAEPVGIAVEPGTRNILYIVERRFQQESDIVELDVAIVSMLAGTLHSAVFEDGPMRGKLRDVVVQSEPVEIVVPSGGAISHTTQELLDAHLRLNYGPSDHGTEDSNDVVFTRFPVSSRANVVQQLATEHLKLFGLDKDFSEIAPLPLAILVPTLENECSLPSTSREAHYAAPTKAMRLPGTTLATLEVIQSLGPSGRQPQLKGSLLWLLHRCKTPFGFRTLRSWLLAPLTNPTAIEERLSCVTFLKTNAVPNGLLNCDGFGSLPDLEAIVSQLGMQRASVGDYVRLLKCLASASDAAVEFSKRTLPAMLGDALKSVVRARRAIAQELKRIPSGGAKNPIDLFAVVDRDIATSQRIQEIRDARAAAEAALKQELESIRNRLSIANLEFKTVSGLDFIIELPLSKQNSVPDDWIVLSRTKTAARFHTPNIVQAHTKLCAAKDRLNIAATDCWKELQKDLFSVAETSSKGSIRKAFLESIAAMGEIDALSALASLANNSGYCAPTINKHNRQLTLLNARHPIQEAISSGYIGNDVELAAGGVWLLTGPNMGGKSALMRAVGLIVVMCQIGSYVPCDKACVPIFSSVMTRMGAADAILESKSTFLLEMRESADILDASDLSTSLVLMDELGRGTSSYDGIAVAHAMLQFLINSRCSLFFVTHYEVLCGPFEQRTNRVECKRMDYRHLPDTDGGAGSLVFLYKVVDGVTPSSFGINVARCAQIPDSLTKRAAEKSLELEGRNKVSVVAQFVRSSQL